MVVAAGNAPTHGTNLVRLGSIRPAMLFTSRPRKLCSIHLNYRRIKVVRAPSQRSRTSALERPRDTLSPRPHEFLPTRSDAMERAVRLSSGAGISHARRALGEEIGATRWTFAILSPVPGEHIDIYVLAAETGR